MKCLFFTLLAIVISAGASLFLQGCTVRFVTNSQEAPVPYPNAWHIESRVRAQINRISAGLQQGQLSQDSADVLAANDALVRHFVREYQGPPAEMADLNPQQTFQLNSMLSDNDRFIDNALQNTQAWNDYFQNGNYDYSSSDHILYLGYLDYQLNRQEADIKAAQVSGSLTPSQARELGNRVQTIRGLRQNYYRSNGRLDLTEEQVSQLSQMTEENGGYLRFRKNGSQGNWNKDRFNTWKTQVPSGLGQGGNTQWGRGQSDNGTGPASAPFQPLPNGTKSPDLFGQKSINTQGSTSSTGSINSKPEGFGQAAQQAPSSTIKPPSTGLGQSTQSSPFTAVPTNTPVPKIQGPAGTSSNPRVNISKPGLTSKPKWVRPAAKATKTPVKVKPVPTRVSNKDDQTEQGNDQGKKPGGGRGE